MIDDEAVAAATAIVRDLARNVAPPYNPPEFNLPTIHAKNGSISLPGAASNSKRTLELELSALASRIKYLEEKASTVNNNALPDTPGTDFGAASPFTAPGAPTKNGIAKPARQLSMDTRQARVTNILAGDPTTFTEEDLGHLRDHVDKQADEIKSQSETINDIRREIEDHDNNLKRTIVKVQHEDIASLEHELHKHQQANEAFQKALQEIGIIITNIANGNLNQKVQIHKVEMDPEIATFKRTINTMIDQLMVFGNEVSRVAREVGTEGRLGGQAQVIGVSGIWEDLTNNGE
jgi:osomolarity two-component system sensor histidine kinase NIK1